MGSLEPGKAADIIAVDVSGLHLAPTADPVPALVNSCSGSEVMMTMVNGRRVYEHGNWNVDIPLARSLARVYQTRRKLHEE